MPGAGAAGGVGFALLAVLGAQRASGVEVVLDLVGLDAALAGADLVVTGEGSLDDNQTGARFDRILDYRLAQVRAELAAHPDGQRLTADFDALATEPTAAQA